MAWTRHRLGQLDRKRHVSVGKKCSAFWVLSLDGDLKGLPWAVGFEDYGGSQSWTGATADLVVGGTISTTTWTQMIIPLEKFRINSSDLDPYTIKQLMFQFESSGDVLLDEISIVDAARVCVTHATRVCGLRCVCVCVTHAARVCGLRWAWG